MQESVAYLIARLGSGEKPEARKRASKKLGALARDNMEVAKALAAALHDSDDAGLRGGVALALADLSDPSLAFVVDKVDPIV